MKKLTIAVCTVSVLAAALTGCGFRDDGTVGVNNPTYVAPGETWVGRTALPEDVVVYRKRGVVYHDGQAYRITKGRYVIVR